MTGDNPADDDRASRQGEVDRAVERAHASDNVDARRPGPTDMFTRDVRTTIPPIVEIPETVEEKQQRRARRLLAALVTVAALLAVATAAYFAWDALDRSWAIDAAERTGTLSDFDHALARLSKGSVGGRATRARLLAELYYLGYPSEGAPGREIGVFGDEAESILRQDEASEAGRAERLIAGVYLALARGGVTRASKLASALVPAGALTAEASRARALAALAVANSEVAIDQAKVAVKHAPGAVRHATLLGWALAGAGQTQEAIASVTPFFSDGKGVGPPEAHLVRARAHSMAGTEEALVLADSHRAALADAPRYFAWAVLLAGQTHEKRGDVSLATAAFEKAQVDAPPGDEQFVLELADGFVAVGDLPAAASLLQQETDRLSAPTLRRQVQAAYWVAAGDLDRARAALKGLPPGPVAALLGGRLAAAEGNVQEAQKLFRSAAEAPSLRLEAALEAAALALTLGNPAEANALLAALREDHPDHPRLIALLADAARAQDDGPAAKALLDAGLKERPANAFLLSAKARLFADAASWAEAHEAIRAAIADHPKDAGRQTERATIARELEKNNEAREAYEAALALAPSFVPALEGFLSLELQERHPAEARALLARIDAAGAASVSIDVLRGQTLVLATEGLGGVKVIRRAISRHPNERALFRALGELYVQAEQYDSALGFFGRARQQLPDGERDLELELLQAISYVRARRAPPAESILEDLPRELSPKLDALRTVVLGRIAELDEQKVRVRERARAAFEADSECLEAMLLLADDARARGQFEEEVAHLRSAVSAVPKSPEAMGRLALVESVPIDERCALRREYLQAAPRGTSAEALRQTLRSCPQ